MIHTSQACKQIQFPYVLQNSDLQKLCGISVKNPHDLHVKV